MRKGKSFRIFNEIINFVKKIGKGKYEQKKLTLLSILESNEAFFIKYFSSVPK